MKILNDISEDEVTSIILKYNLGSFRFRDALKEYLTKNKLDEQIISRPNITNDRENELRKKLVQSWNGKNVGGYLSQNFPKDVAWKKAVLNQDDLQKVKYIDYDYWNELSHNTRLVAEGAKSIRNGVEVFNQSNKPSWDAFEVLKQGQQFPPPVLVAANETADLVVIDGHLRLTVYLIDPQYTPKEVKVLVGYSENFLTWDLY